MSIEIEDIRRLDIGPGETLVIWMDLPRDPFTGEVLVGFMNDIKKRLPEGVNVLIVEPGIEMAVVASHAGQPA